SRRSAARRVRFLPEKQIEREAQLLLDEWSAQGHEVGVPAPLECILESHLQLGFELEDLRARFGGHDVLGAIWFADRVVRIDSSFDAVEHPAMLGCQGCKSHLNCQFASPPLPRLDQATICRGLSGVIS